MIFYFTATGNSKYIAKKIGERFGGDLINIKEAVEKNQFNYQSKDGELVFFVFPTYYFALPKMVEDFIEKVSFSNNVTVCGIASCGGNSGGCDYFFSKLIEKKNLTLGGFYQVVMPENYIMMFNTPLLEEQIMIIRRGDKSIKDIIDSVEYNFRMPHKSSFMVRLGSKLARSIYYKGRPTKKFFVGDNCIGCGICQKVCTDKIIKLKEGKPIWTADRCCHCSGCINLCPLKAIEYGKKTSTRERYINPFMKGDNYGKRL